MPDQEVAGSTQAKKVKRKSKKTTKKKAKKAKARKASTKKAKSSRKNGSVPYYDADGMLCLTKDDLTRYELAQYRVANDAQAIKLKRNEIEQVKVGAAQRVHQLTADVATLTTAQQLHVKELKEVQDEIGGLYGIDMSKMSYDDATGRIYLNGEPVLHFS